MWKVILLEDFCGFRRFIRCSFYFLSFVGCLLFYEMIDIASLLQVVEFLYLLSIYTYILVLSLCRLLFYQKIDKAINTEV